MLTYFQSRLSKFCRFVAYVTIAYLALKAALAIYEDPAGLDLWWVSGLLLAGLVYALVHGLKDVGDGFVRDDTPAKLV